MSFNPLLELVVVLPPWLMTWVEWFLHTKWCICLLSTIAQMAIYFPLSVVPESSGCLLGRPWPIVLVTYQATINIYLLVTSIDCHTCHRMQPVHFFSKRRLKTLASASLWCTPPFLLKLMHGNKTKYIKEKSTKHGQLRLHHYDMWN